MKWRVFVLIVCLYGLAASKAEAQQVLPPKAPKPQTGIVVGTVIDVNGDPVPSANVVLQGPVLESSHTAVSNDNGFFEFDDLNPGNPHLPSRSAPLGFCQLDFALTSRSIRVSI